MKALLRPFLLLCLLAPLTVWAQKFRELHGHTLDVNTVAFSPDGQLLASGSSDRTIRLWNARTGALSQTLDAHTASVNSLSFSPDGTLLASGSSDGTLKIWDVVTGRLLKSFDSQGKPLECVSFGADGATIATAGWDRTARLWDIHENWEQSFPEHKNTVYAVAIDPQGQYLYTAGAEAVVTLWEINTGRLVRQLKGHKNTIRGLAVSPDGKLLASASLDRTVRIWKDAATFQGIKGHTDIVRSVAFSPDGQLVVTASRDRSARIWNALTGEEMQVLNGHIGALWQAVFSPDGKYVATASADKTIRLWDVSHLNISPIRYEVARKDPERYKPPMDISTNIPVIAQQPQRFALVIANEAYSDYNTGAGEINVEYALSDGLLFAEYAEKRLGIPRRNILILTNGTAAQMDNELTKLSLLAKNYGYKAELFFFYAGHGIPQEGTRESFLLPVDVNPHAPNKAILISEVISRLTQPGPARLTMFLDACFSGQSRSGDSPIAARGVIIKPKPVEVQGNTVIFSASTGEQAALPYRQARHGLFSYFLMMLLNQYPEGITYGELADRLEGEVSLHALLLFNRPQTPTLQASPSLEDSWKSWEF
ncbi:MAG: caspase family protein [Bacteroidetes bacterium]|nr:caspase family protein [Bacteroidota bacterium]